MAHSRPLLLIALTAGWSVATASSVATLFAMTGQIERFAIPAPDGAKICAYPSLARLNDDRLLCVFSAFDASRDGKIMVVGVFSSDHGHTWSPSQVLIDSPDGNDYDPSIVVIGPRVIVTATTTPLHDHTITTSRTMAVRSEDGGRSWSAPYEIPMGRHYTSGKVNNGIVTGDGTALLGFTWEKNLETGRHRQLTEEGLMEEVNAALMSFDHGLTWAASESVELEARKPADATDAINGVCEPALVECDDGSIYMLSRTGLTNLYGCRSIDGGRTWSTPQPTVLEGHNAPADLCRFTGDRPGILVAWNNSPQNRWHLCVAVSFDGCRTWSAPRVIEPLDGVESSYPACVQAGDGKLLVVYQQNRQGGRDIRGVRFDPAWAFAEGPSTTASSSSATQQHPTPDRALSPRPHFSVTPKASAVQEGQSTPVAMTWQWGPKFARPCSAFGCAATPAGVITVGGTYWTSPQSGNPTKQWLHDVCLLPPYAQVWKHLTDYPVEVGQLMLVPVKDRLYAVGGRNANQALRETYWISPSDPESGWQRGPDLPRPLYSLKGGVSGNIIYAVTDEQAMEPDAARSAGPPTILALDTAQSDAHWTEVGQVPDLKTGFRTAAVAGGKLLLFGGAVPGPNGSLILQDAVWAFDLERRSWSACSPLPYPLRDASAVALNDRLILIAGGVEDAASPQETSDGNARIILSNRCLVYDSTVDAFTFVEPLRLAVADHGCVVLNSEILGIGGEDSTYHTRTDLVQQASAELLIQTAIDVLPTTHSSRHSLPAIYGDSQPSASK